MLGCTLAALAPATTTQATDAQPGGGSPAAKLAVLPLHNLSATAAPLRELGAQLVFDLRRRGLPVLDDVELEELMARHRMRYTGGVSREMARALREETGASTVLVTAVDLFDDRDPPKLGLIARLVATADPPSILWMGSVARAGDQSPGVLELGMIHDPLELRDRVLAELGEVVAVAAAGEGSRTGAQQRPEFRMPKWKRHALRPKSAYRAPVFDAGGPVRRIAVVPLDNESGRRNAGEILALQLIKSLHAHGGVEVLEPGLVRQTMLESRLIVERGGPSLPQTELLRVLLDVDLVLAGRVTQYHDPVGTLVSPSVQFAVDGIDARTRQAVWSSISVNRGAGGVRFFDWGRVHTAHALASEMARAVIDQLLGDGDLGTNRRSNAPSRNGGQGERPSSETATP